ncbi:sulfotransferase family protein [Actinomadura sp. WMMB 499]|uniref:sulfotransferase family protein n=1 Tax=Actinomadura sp. WMMB 499 TaxID=1219491 RepID=UPI00159E07F8|nr:sulfotransferase family protein [Actinomadura sp. WMMB 499]
MLKVIGAGLPRTGTTSMKAALERLGLGPCHHMFEILSDPAQAERWSRTADGGPVAWDRVLDGYASCQDWPSSGYWRELAAAYPDAKIVLTVRDPSRWHTSFTNLLTDSPAAKDPDELPEAARPVALAMQRMRPVLDRHGRDLFGDGWSLEDGVPGEDAAVAAFERYVETVRAEAPADRLLVFDVREGWGPLCSFLGLEEPDEPFPHLNDSDGLKKVFGTLMTDGHVTVPSQAASPAAEGDVPAANA